MGQCRLRSRRRLLLALLFTQQAHHLAELFECLAGCRAQQLGGFAYRGRRQVGSDLEPTGVQRQQRDPVGEHVVHLSGDPGALCQSCSVFVQTLIGLRPQGALPQFKKKLASGSDEHPPGGDGEGQWSDLQQHRHRVGGRTVDGEEQQGWDPQCGGE